MFSLIVYSCQKQESNAAQMLKDVSSSHLFCVTVTDSEAGTAELHFTPFCLIRLCALFISVVRETFSNQ